jgi:hypothetical protein
MNKKIICLTRGFSEKDIIIGRKAFYKTHPHAKRLKIFPVTGELLGAIAGDVIQSIADGSEKQREPESTSDPAFRAMLIDSRDRNQVINIMRSFKKVLSDPDNMAFAMITETAKTWTFQAYFDHLAQEHEFMKTHSPKDNPDMKKVK